VPTNENFLTNLPDDKEALKAMLHSRWQERERQEKRAEEYLRKAEEQRKRADELYLEKLRRTQTHFFISSAVKPSPQRERCVSGRLTNGHSRITRNCSFSNT
jgi:hypothetical protein